MEKLEKRVSLRKLTGKDVNENLHTIYGYIGTVKLSDLDKLQFYEYPVSFIIPYKKRCISFHVSHHEVNIMDSTHQFLQEMPSQLISFLYTHQNKKIILNPLLQSSRTNLSPLYCIYFIRQRSKRKSYSSILSQFTDDFRVNDALITNLVQL